MARTSRGTSRRSPARCCGSASGSPNEDAAPDLHRGDFDVDEDAIGIGVRVLVAVRAARAGLIRPRARRSARPLVTVCRHGSRLIRPHRTARLRCRRSHHDLGGGAYSARRRRHHLASDEQNRYCARRRHARPHGLRWRRSRDRTHRRPPTRARARARRRSRRSRRTSRSGWPTTSVAATTSRSTRPLPPAWTRPLRSSASSPQEAEAPDRRGRVPARGAPADARRRRVQPDHRGRLRVRRVGRQGRAGVPRGHVRDRRPDGVEGAEHHEPDLRRGAGLVPGRCGCRAQVRGRPHRLRRWRRRSR